MAKRIIPVYTTGEYRTPSAVGHALPSELKPGQEFVYTTDDGNDYCKLLWELAPPPVEVVFENGARAARAGRDRDENSYLDGPLFDAWDAGYMSV